MKYWILVWAGLWRKKVRTVLTMFSIVVAFLLFGWLLGFNLGVNNAVAGLDNRLFTANRYGAGRLLPLAHRDRIASVDGVVGVAPLVFFSGYYQDSRNAVTAFATDPRVLFQLHKEFKIPEEQLAEMARTRTGALVTTALASRYGWKIGDTVSLGTSIWTTREGRSDYQFQVVGIYESGSAAINGVLINYEYLDGVRRSGTGTVHFYITGVQDPRRASDVLQRIDQVFANSADETETQTEQAYVASTIKQAVDIGFIVNAIVGAVLFTLLFLTVNTMMQSVRERVPELGVLKALGFTDGAVAAFVMVEAALLCVTSAILGLGLARLSFGTFAAVLGEVSMPPTVIAAGVAAAFVLGLISALPPAVRAARLTIVDAIAGR